jgi:hypothetical protein
MASDGLMRIILSDMSCITCIFHSFEESIEWKINLAHVLMNFVQFWFCCFGNFKNIGSYCVLVYCVWRFKLHLLWIMGSLATQMMEMSSITVVFIKCNQVIGWSLLGITWQAVCSARASLQASLVSVMLCLFGNPINWNVDTYFSNRTSFPHRNNVI